MKGAVDLRHQLERQVRFLQRSCLLFDSGEDDEAIRLAVSLRNIFFHNPHSRSTTRSLVHQLGVFDTVTLLSTGNDPATANNLVRMVVDVGKVEYGYIPKLENHFTRPLSYLQWWLSEPVFIRNRQPITRCNLVSAARDQDGGAHVDDGLEERYWKLIYNSAPVDRDVLPPRDPNEFYFHRNAHLAALRQIAHEVLISDNLTALADPPFSGYRPIPNVERLSGEGVIIISDRVH